MDRFENIQYNIATEGAAVVAGVALAGFIAAALAKSAVQNKLEESSKEKFEKEYASGNVSAKTARKAGKIYEAGMPYPEYVKKRESMKKFAPIIQKIIEEESKGADKEMDTFCKSKPEFKPLYGMALDDVPDQDDIIKSMLERNDKWYLAIYVIVDLAAMKEVMDAAVADGSTDNREDFDQLRYLAEDYDIEAMKKAGMKIVDIAIGQFHRIIDKHIDNCIHRINAIPEIPVKANKKKESNPDDIYITYEIYFTLK